MITQTYHVLTIGSSLSVKIIRREFWTNHHPSQKWRGLESLKVETNLDLELLLRFMPKKWKKHWGQCWVEMKLHKQKYFFYQKNSFGENSP